MKKLRRTQYISRSTKDSFFVEEKKKRPIVPLLIIGVILTAVVLFVITGLRYGGKIVVDRVTVESVQLPESFDGFRILQISDIHGKEFGDRQKNLKAILDKLEYDVVIFTGDYIAEDNDPDYWILKDLVACIKEDVPMYYILGDCDYTPPVVSETSEKWKMCIKPTYETDMMLAFKELGVEAVYPVSRLTNESGDSIFLTGIEYDRELLNKMDFDQDEDFSICVTHKPINYNVTRRLRDVNKRTITEVDYDLSISGHTLGGQYRVPILGALYSEDEGLFPQETSLKGLSRDDAGRYNYINGGLGVESGFRFFSNPEISIIELKHVDTDE